MAVAARWFVPVTVAAVVVGGGVAASASDGGSPDLPERSAVELLAAVQDAEPTPFSATVRTVAELGLPALPDLGGAGGTGGSSDPAAVLTRLLSGENQLRVWVGGPEQQRVSLLDDFAELDVVRDGDVLWTYSSVDDTATRTTLPSEADLERAKAELEAEHQAEEDRSVAPGALPTSPEDVTPEQLAEQLLAAVEPSTEVSVGPTQVVAGRDAYTLLVTPRDEVTLVGTTEVAVDAETGIVLQVVVGSTAQEAPAFVTGYTSLELGAPGAEVFSYSPAPGTTVVDGDAERAEAMREARESWSEDDGTEPTVPDTADLPEPVVHGERWSTVLELSPGEAVAALGATPEPPSGAAPEVDPQQLLDQLTERVDGGRAVSTALLSVLLTDDGRVLLGPVPVSVLQSYAG